MVFDPKSLYICFVLFLFVNLIFSNENIKVSPNQHIIIDNTVDSSSSNNLFINNTIKPIKIGIIGTGIGGSSCAYYLHKIFNSNSIVVQRSSSGGDNIPSSKKGGQYPIEITMFEKDRIGGRARSVEIDKGNVELGASIIHPLNENLNQIVKDLGLEKVFPKLGDSSEPFHIWNGNRIVYTQSSYSFVDKIKMLVNYYWDPIRFKNSRDDIVQKFLSSYQRKEPFQTVEEFFQVNSLVNTTKLTAKQFFQDEVGISEPFIQDILSAAIRVNYNQDYDSISAFAALIALVGSEDGLYSIKDGNYHLPEAMIKSSNSSVIHGTVTKIKRIDNNNNDGTDQQPTYKVYSKDPANFDTINEYEFDFVIVATPLELTNIELVNIKNSQLPKKNFKEVNVYLVAADSISSEYFGIQPNPLTTPLHILTSYNQTLPFYCVSKNPRGVLDDSRTLFKIFANQKLDESLLDKIFNNYTVYVHHPWKAYPVLTPVDKFPPIQIDKGLYYVNAFEHAVSTMETETIASKNIAKLIAQSIKRPYVNI